MEHSTVCYKGSITSHNEFAALTAQEEGTACSKAVRQAKGQHAPTESQRGWHEVSRRQSCATETGEATKGRVFGICQGII